jgi:hypothetical protein
MRSNRPHPPHYTMRYLFLASCVGLSGCIPYPVYKQLQPQTRVRVVNEIGGAITGANVILLSNTYPYGREHHRESLLTDKNGVALFESRQEWRVESLMIHGWQAFFWNICVFMPGYTTYLTEHNSASTFEDNPTVVIRRGDPKPCPAVKVN